MERRDFLKSAAAAAGAVALERAASPLFAAPSRPDLAVAAQRTCAG